MEAFDAWMRKYHEDPSQDDIIFEEDEETHDQVKLADLDDSLLM